jgi:hypothetical protein
LQVALNVDPYDTAGQDWLAKARDIMRSFSKQTSFAVGMTNGGSWMIDTVDEVCMGVHVGCTVSVSISLQCVPS